MITPDIKVIIERGRKGPLHPSELLREWCLKNNVTITNLANKLGISPAGLSPMLNKKRKWSDQFIEKVSRLTEIHVEDLIIIQYRYDRWFRTQMGED